MTFPDSYPPPEDAHAGNMDTISEAAGNGKPHTNEVYHDLPIPGMAERLIAKFIDMTAAGVTVYGFSAATHSYLIGLIVGYGWLALSDCGGTIGKWILGLQVIEHKTGRECSMRASILRNLPIIAAYLPYRLHAALLGMDRKAYLKEYRMAALLLSVVGLMVLVALIIEMSNKSQRRHFGDRLANTVVVEKKRKVKK